LISNIGVEGAHSNSITSSHFIRTYPLGTIDGVKKCAMNADAKYDQAMHQLKSKPALRRKKIIKILKAIKLYKVAKWTKEFFGK
jgi:hypothetical protein